MNNTTNSTTAPIALLIAQAVAGSATQTDGFFMFTMAAIIVLMQFGFGLFEAGMVRSSSTMKKSLKKCFLCTMMSMLAFWLFGYAIMFGGSYCVAGAMTYWAFWNMPSVLYAHFWLQFAYAVTSVNIAAGSLAERTKMITYLVFALIWAGFSEPVIAHWVWYPTGFLLTVCGQPFVQGANITFTPFQDQSGDAVVYLTGGVAGLFGAVLCGPRTGRFDGVNGEAKSFRHHKEELVSIGSGLITFGMLALNTVGQLSINITPAVSGALTMINTMISGAVGAFTVYFVIFCVHQKTSLVRITSGAIAGMVSVASDANNISTWAACIFGFFAALAYLFWSWILQKAKVDDATDSFAVFGAPAMWGLIGTAFLDNARGVIFSGSMQSLWFLAWQCCGVAVVFAWAGAASGLIFGILRVVRAMRASEDHEMKTDEQHMHYSRQPHDYGNSMQLAATPHGNSNSYSMSNA